MFENPSYSSGVIRLIHRAYNPASGMNHEVLHGFVRGILWSLEFPGECAKITHLSAEMLWKPCGYTPVWNKAETLQEKTLLTHILYHQPSGSPCMMCENGSMVSWAPTGLQAPSDTVFGDGFWGLNTQRVRLGLGLSCLEHWGSAVGI